MFTNDLLTIVRAISLPCGRAVFALETVRPVLQEKLFVRRKECWRGADDWPERRAHLHYDDHEDHNPKFDPSAKSQTEMTKAGVQKSQSEISGDREERQMQDAHGHKRIRRLRKNPGYRGEPNQENR